MRQQSLTFEEWIENLKQVALSQYDFTDKGIATIDWPAYRNYYDDGYTPEEAMAEDMSYA